MATARLTKALLKGLTPSGKTEFWWDEDLPGFGVRVAPAGKAAFVVQFRQRKATKRITLGAVDVVNLDRARERAKEILASVALGQDPFPEETSTPTFDAVADDFLAFTRAKRAERTAADYRKLLETKIRPTFGAKQIGDITRAEVEKWHEAMKGTPRRANYALTILVAVFSFAVKRQIIGAHDHPALGISKFGENKRDRYLTLEELARFGAALAALEAERTVSPWAAAALRLLILTGARSSEILTLEWSFVYMERGVLRLPTSKTGRKDIVLSGAALAVLRAVPKVEGCAYVIAGRRHGERMTSLQRPFGAVCTKAEIIGLRVHDLRHSAASFATSAGVGLPIVGKVLGQSQAYTQQRYSHIHDSAERAAVETIAAAVGPLLGTGAVSSLKKGKAS
ncbi:tyrosine-type recombinase/integrase [Xanthobacter sp. DSM 24535]|uniref:tyrosine-type recombinase/integrase n=1 Tax=Roseixanthobacter psychrophilus TaxID=3119917 RepID=UPI00372B2160